MTTERLDPADLRAFLAPITRHRGLIVTFVVAATLSSVAFTFVVSERYRADTTILYQPREEIAFRPKTRDALGFPPPLVPLESIGNTLDEVLRSDALLEETVNRLHLDVPEVRTSDTWYVQAYYDVKDAVKEFRGNAMQILKYGRLLPRDPHGEAIATLRDNVGLKRTAKAYTFELQAVHQKPETAAAIVNTMGHLLSDFLRDEHARSARETRGKVEPRLQQTADEVAGLRASIEEFKRTAGVASLAEEVSLRLKGISDFQQQAATTNNELRSLRNRLDGLLAELQRQEPDVRFESTTENNPVVQQMRLDLAKLEVQRSGLLEKYTENHADVRAVDAELAQVRQKLRQEVETVVASVSTRVNDIHQKLVAERIDTETQIQTLEGKREALARSIALGQQAVRTLTEKEPALAELTLRLNAAEQAYELLSEAQEEARLAESKSVSEVSVLHDAAVPVAPARPIKIVHVGTSFALSLLLALSLALLTNVFDSRVRTIEDAQQALNVPVLATIPEVSPASVHQVLNTPAP